LRSPRQEPCSSQPSIGQDSVLSAPRLRCSGLDCG
jgi:hypothetical protein